MASSFGVGTSPTAIAERDFNGDGYIDLVTANTNSNNISVLLGNGLGSFGAATNFSAGTNPVSVAVGDFDNDGEADLVVVNRGSNNISILLGNGSGSFGAPTNYAVGSSPRSVALVDFNGDGKTDLGVADFFDNNVAVLLGNGGGTFGSRTNFGTGMGPTFVAASDLNADGKPDLLVANFQSDNVSVLLGNGAGGFSSTNFASGFIGPVAVVASDLNSDGRIDVAVAGDNGTLNLLAGNGSGGLGLPVTIYSKFPDRLSHLAVGDLNNDGKPDLVIATWTKSTVGILLGNADGTFAPAIYYSPGSLSWAVALGDLNHDNKSDLAVVNSGSNDVTILTGDGSGRFVQADLYPTGNLPRAVAVGDFNNDGRDDAAVASIQPFRVVFFLNDGTGHFVVSANIDLANAPAAIAFGDFDNDGNLDLVLANSPTNNVTILRGNGVGGFFFAGDFPASFAPSSVAVGDFNNDGNPDLAVSNSTANMASILIGNGTGGFGAPISFAAGAGPGFVAVGDLNNDGQFDLVVANSNSNNVLVLLGNGAASFVATSSFAVESSPSSVSVGDLNGDGKADLAVSNLSSASVSVLVGDGLGGFSGSTNYTVGSSPYAVAIADFNGDYKPDLAVANYNSSNASILLNTGTGTFGKATHFRIGGSPISLAPGDFNADGAIDLAVAMDQTYTLGILSNTCSAITTPLPGLTVNDIAIDEVDNGTTSAVFTVSLSSPSNQTISASYSTKGQTAASTVDFQPVVGRLVFTPGQVTRTIIVPVAGDTLDEFDESFGLFVSLPINATIARRQGICTIKDNDPPPSVFIGDVSLLEGNSGTSSAIFTVTLSTVSGKPISVDYSTADGTATAGSDYVSSSGTVSIPTGQLTRSILVPVIGDTINELDETFFVVFTNPQNVTIARAQGTGTIINDDTPKIQFSFASYTISETGPRVDITLSRSGDTTGSASVSFATNDAAGLTNCNVFNSIASPRCDYINALGTLSFAAGETTRSFSIAIIDDSYAEGNETFTISLNGPLGATLGVRSLTTVTITDNETTHGPNPIDNTEFFVRQQYLDFLGREPDPPGFAGWVNTINNCTGDTTQCDRIHVSQLFFQSAEFQERGYFVYRFYPVAFGRKPDYDEFVPALASVSGFLDNNQLEAAKVAFIANFMAQPAFANTYNPLTNMQYVDTLLNTASVTLSNPQLLIDGLNNSTLTRGQVLRQIVESPEVSTKYNHQAYAVMEYFGYLRRQPDAFYLDWIEVLDQTNDPRGMVTGFVNSLEYRQRFGP
ncbi:MAG: FG-GAP-like repeat-containing protein [Pyrinomonadaceae bacterium]